MKAITQTLKDNDFLEVFSPLFVLFSVFLVYGEIGDRRDRSWAQTEALRLSDFQARCHSLGGTTDIAATFSKDTVIGCSKMPGLSNAITVPHSAVKLVLGHHTDID